MTKEEKEKFIEKWSPFMEGLSKSFNNRYKYASIYEKTILNSDPKYYKFLLSLLYNIFKECKNIPMSTKKHNFDSCYVGNFFTNDLFEGNDLANFAVMSFNTVISKAVKTKIETEELPKVSFIGIEPSDEENMISVYY